MKTTSLPYIRASLLRHFPGRIGRKYTHKDLRRVALAEFDKALDECRGLTAIDLGANVGEFTRRLSKTAGRVIAFEPDPWSLEHLRNATSDLTNLEIVPAAAGIEDGSILLYRHPDFGQDPLIKSQSSSVIASKSNISQENAHSVPLVDFPRYLSELDEEVGILKIDIEGAECDILEKLLDQPDLGKKLRYIFCETHERNIPKQKDRVAKLREKARAMRSPKVNLDWH